MTDTVRKAEQLDVEEYRYRIYVCLDHQVKQGQVGACGASARASKGPPIRCGRRVVHVDGQAHHDGPTYWQHEPVLEGAREAHVCGKPACLTDVQQDAPRNTPQQVEGFVQQLHEQLAATLTRKSQYTALLAQVRRGEVAADQALRRLRELQPMKGVQAVHYDPRTGDVAVDAGVNRVVISGRRISGRRTFTNSGDTPPAAVGFIGLDSTTTAPADGTDQFGATHSIKAYDSGFGTITGAGATPVKHVGQATWTQADNPGPKTFVVARMGLCNASTNAAGILYSLLGGTGVFSADYTNLSSFTLKIQIEVTLSNQSAQ